MKDGGLVMHIAEILLLQLGQRRKSRAFDMFARMLVCFTDVNQHGIAGD